VYPPWLPLPLSLAQSDAHDRVIDCLLRDDLAAVGNGGAPFRFNPDFKSDTKLLEYFGRNWTPPDYEVRTRTRHRDPPPPLRAPYNFVPLNKNVLPTPLGEGPDLARFIHEGDMAFGIGRA
jgi:hypothetical protein